MPGGSKKGGGLEVDSAYKMKGHALPGPFQKKGQHYGGPLKQKMENKGRHHVEASSTGSKTSDAMMGDEME